jgi:NAD(P)-dependent dehydrogenase (short-subunit alcohol dehydrogenase family)
MLQVGPYPISLDWRWARASRLVFDAGRLATCATPSRFRARVRPPSSASSATCATRAPAARTRSSMSSTPRPSGEVLGVAEAQVLTPRVAEQVTEEIDATAAFLAEVDVVGAKASVPMITKGGLNTITKHLAIEYAKDGIRFNAVARASSIRRFTKTIRKTFYNHSTPWAFFRASKTSWTRSCI